MAGDHCSCQEPPYVPPCSFCTDGPDDLLERWQSACDQNAFLLRRLAAHEAVEVTRAAYRAACRLYGRVGNRIQMLEPLSMDELKETP